MVAARLLVVLAERVADPVVRQHDAAKVRVTGEVDAEQVVDLALEPVGGLPHALDARDRRARAVELDLEHDRVTVGVREQVVHHLDHVPLRASRPR